MNDAIHRDGLKPGDVAVVTGAAQGLGRGIARRLAAEGARIAVWDIDQAMAAETVEMCEQAGAEAHGNLGSVLVKLWWLWGEQLSPSR